jgi:D-serine deaminase-like pyridoxal phosphate-dependent protein
MTPCLVVDLEVLDHNVTAMAIRAGDRGLALRPHVKTHKCVEIARRQLDAGACGLTVATVSEAEVFVEAGYRNVFIAYPVWADHARGGLTVRGVFTFPGHSYGPGLAAGAAADEARALKRAAEVLDASGLPAQVLSGGSTPTATLTESGTLTEMRPGVYVFGDAQQLELGTCTVADVALTAAATVVSRRPGQVVLDAGSKVLGADRPTWTTGFGRLPDYPEARLSALSEHHVTVTWSETSALPELGAVLRAWWMSEFGRVSGRSSASAARCGARPQPG